MGLIKSTALDLYTYIKSFMSSVTSFMGCDALPIQDGKQNNNFKKNSGIYDIVYEFHIVVKKKLC